MDRKKRQVPSLRRDEKFVQVCLESRRLMIANNANVETAAFQVGYGSSSQFSREYARMFGKPPRRDISALRFSEKSGSRHVSAQ
jgi:AraC-like DNA-binding protein